MARNALLGMTVPDDEWRMTRAVNALGFGPMTQATRAGRQNALLSAVAPAERPNDYLAPVAETISPTMGGYGTGQMIGEGSKALGRGEYGAGTAGLALGMAGLLPGYKAAPTRQLDNLGYYSQALEAAKSWPQTKGSAEQARTWLTKSGTKEAELAATGFDQFLAGRPNVTRDELIAHLEKSRVRLNEVVRGAPAMSDYDKHALEVWGQPFNALNEDQQFSVRNYVDRGLNGFDGEASKTTKWSSYSLDPGNPSYRETVLHLPGNRKPTGQPLDMSDLEGGARREWEPEATPDFRSGHFPEPNITGHLMTSMVKDADGRPVYLIDQIQSDWGQKLRDGGVRDEKKIAALKQELEKHGSDTDGPEWGRADQFLEQIGETRGGELSRDDALNLLDRVYRNKAYDEHPMDVRDQASTLWNALNAEIKARERLAAEIETAESSVSGHPLVNTTDQWVNTTLRRALMQAAEADADRIAIPSGKTVESYNPQGDSDGNAVFYDQIVPKNLANILKRIDKDSATKEIVNSLMTPTKGESGNGFSIFNLSPQARAKIKEGLPLFGLPWLLNAMQPYGAMEDQQQ